MSVTVPLGQREDQRLEFKRSESLLRTESVAREVVGLLNADGGEVWVGVREEGGEAVEVEGVKDAERERDRLRDALVDLVEPRPTPDEVGIEVVGEGTQCLRIRAEPQPERGPYALRRGERLEFPIRFMDRLRPMSRSEVGAAFDRAQRQRRGDEAAGSSAGEQALLDDQKKALASAKPTFWLGLELVGSSRRLDLGRVMDSGILEDPSLSGNRWLGITFHLALKAVLFEGHRENPFVSARQGRSWLTVGGDSPFQLSIAETGSLRSQIEITESPFSCPPEPERSPFPELRNAHVLYPKALLEYPASLFRLLRALDAKAPIGEVSAAVALCNVEGWFIRPGPDHPAWDFPFALRLPPPALERRPRPFTNGRSFVGPVLRFSSQEVREFPDRCAFRLMSQVFKDFGWFEEEIPYFDRARGRFEFSS